MNKAIIGIAAASLAAASAANAQIVFNIFESGGNVELTMSGDFDLAATQGYISDSTAYNGYSPNLGAIATGSGNTNYYGMTQSTWTPFGSGGFGNWDASGGDTVALFSNPVLGVPAGYVSGQSLSATATKFGTTLAALGMTPGTYTTTLVGPSGVSDSVIVNVGIPAPGTAALHDPSVSSAAAVSFFCDSACAAVGAR